MLDLDARRDLTLCPRSMIFGVVLKAMLGVSAVLVAGVESLSPLNELVLVLLSKAESIESERAIAACGAGLFFAKFDKKDSIAEMAIEIRYVLENLG